MSPTLPSKIYNGIVRVIGENMYEHNRRLARKVCPLNL
jgi:hypothetical protein